MPEKNVRMTDRRQQAAAVNELVDAVGESIQPKVPVRAGRRRPADKRPAKTGPVRL